MTSASSHPLSALDRFGCFRSLHANFKANLKKFMLDIEVDLFLTFPTNLSRSPALKQAVLS